MWIFLLRSVIKKKNGKVTNLCTLLCTEGFNSRNIYLDVWQKWDVHVFLLEPKNVWRVVWILILVCACRSERRSWSSRLRSSGFGRTTRGSRRSLRTQRPSWRSSPSGSSTPSTWTERAAGAAPGTNTSTDQHSNTCSVARSWNHQAPSVLLQPSCLTRISSTSQSGSDAASRLRSSSHRGRAWQVWGWGLLLLFFLVPLSWFKSHVCDIFAGSLCYSELVCSLFLFFLSLFLWWCDSTSQQYNPNAEGRNPRFYKYWRSDEWWSTDSSQPFFFFPLLLPFKH